MIWIPAAHLLVVTEGSSIFLVQNQFRREDHLLVPDLWVLLVKGLGLDLLAFLLSSDNVNSDPGR
jgi:hypothetical protein